MAIDRPFFGIALFVVANGLTAIINTVAKYYSPDIHALQVTWGYFLAMTTYILGYAALKRIPLRQLYTSRRKRLHLLRSAIIVTSISSLFMGLTYLPMADTIAITFASPFFTTLLSIPLLGERVGMHRWCAVAVGLVGVLLVVQPGGAMHWAIIMPVISAFAFGSFQIATRKLSSTEPTIVALFYTGAGSLLWSSIIAGFVWTPLSLHLVAMFFVIGLLGVVAHFFIIRAAESAPASLLAPFNYTKLIWATILGYFVFDQIPGLNVIGGTAIIVGSGLYVLWREQRTRSRT
jgi:drug/metabolite transporter (DMT)-like permease